MTRFFHVLLKTKTPLIAVRKTVKNWYMSYGDHIPARMFLGSIITGLAFKDRDLPGKIRESFKTTPVINVSDLYIVDEEPCYPAPPFLMQSKIKDLQSNYCSMKDILELYLRPTKKNEVSELIGEFLRVCGKPYMKDYGGNLIKIKKGTYDFITCLPRIVPVESVGVDPRTGSNVKGLLFTYEAIPPNTIFHGFIVVSGAHEGLISRMLGKLKGRTLYIGRGISKGYGQIVVQEISENHIYSRVHIANAIEKAIKVSDAEIDPFIMLSELTLFNTRFKPVVTISSGINYSVGWSKLVGLRKPMIKTHRHGTIIYAKYPDEHQYYTDLLATPGYNFFIPLEALWEIVGVM